MLSLPNTFSRFFKVGFALTLVVLALAFYFAYQKIQLLSETSNLVTHTQGVRLELSQVTEQVQEATAQHRRFLTSKDSTYLDTLPILEAAIFASLQRLDSLTQGSADQQANLHSLRSLIQNDLTLMKQVSWQDIQQMSPSWIANRAAMDSIRAQAKRMDRAEQLLLGNRELSRDKSQVTAPLFALLLLLVALVILIFSYLRIRNDLRRSRQQLETNLENTNRILQLNETLQHAEQLSHTGNWQIDIKTGRRQYSDNIYRLFGYEPGAFEPVPANWLPNVHPDDRQSVLDFVEKNNHSGLTFRYNRPDGQLRYMYVGGKTVTGTSGDQLLIGTIQDVTEPYRLRKELEERIQFTETLLNNLVDGIAAYDHQLNYLSFNKANERLTGHKKEEVVGKSMLELFPQVKTDSEMVEYLQEALRGNEARFTSKSSVLTEKVFDYSFVPLRHPDGEIFGVLTIAHDVTEAQKLRNQLEERTRFAELLVESSVDMIAVYDENMRYTVWNKRCEDLVNLKKEDVLGKSMLEIFPMLKESALLETLKQALNGQSSYIPPQQSIISQRYYESYVQPLHNEAGKVTGVLTVNHDVTESYQLRQELEERSRFAETIIESSVDIIVTYDTQLRITAWNKKSEEVFRLTKEEVLGRHVTEIFPNIINSKRLTDLESVLQGHSVQYEPEELLPYGIHANLYLLPLKDHNGGVNGVLSISHDVTDVVRSASQLANLNQSLEEKNKELANTNAELASFSYVASHDLQEPLRKIQAFGSRILTSENERLSEMGKDAFRRMQSAADRMQQLIEDLLTYSRTNTEPGEFATEDLNEIFQEAKTEVSEVILEKQAVIEADHLPQARVVAFQFRQLLVNLLSNALKYQKSDVIPHVRISCTIVSSAEIPQGGIFGERYYRIAVADNGIGFEQQYAERIFELFQRLHGRSEYKGTGIGLAICRKIMQNHHGYLFAEGRPDEGATFTIYLPV